MRELGFALRIDRQFGGVDQRGAIHDLSQFTQLLCGELGLGRSSPPNNVNLLHPAFGQSIEGMFGNVRGAKLSHWLGEDAAHVRSHIALSNDRHRFLTEVECSIAVIWVTIEPSDELGRGVAAKEVLARDAHSAVGLRSASKYYCVVSGPEFGDGNVTTDTHVAQEIESRGASNTLVYQDRFLELRMVRGDAATNQTERCRQALDHVDSYRQTGTQQSFRRIKAARASAYDRDMDRGDCDLHDGLQVSTQAASGTPPTAEGCFTAKWQTATVVAVSLRTQ
jgi:hypothetical protein